MVENTIIARQQQRRGLKQNLPQPLRAGEFGFATDSRQVYIGSDTADVNSAQYNKHSIFENTLNAQAITQSIANVNLIFFNVPHKRYPKGSFDGIGTVASWNTTDLQYTGASLNVFNPEITQVGTGAVSANTSSSVNVVLSASNAYISVGDIISGTGVVGTPAVTAVSGASVTMSSAQTLTTPNVLTFTPNNLVNINTSERWTASQITVAINGARQVGDSTNALPATDKAYSFSSSKLASNTHTLNFRVAPLITDDVTITYVDSSAIIKALTETDTIFSGSSTRSFYAEQNIPSYRYLDEDMITVSHTTGQGIIGLQFKHLAVAAEGTTISSPGSLALGNLLVSRNSDKDTLTNITAVGDQLTIDVGSGHAYNPATYSYIYIQNAGVQWINNKAIDIDTFNTANVVVTVPSANAWQTARAATSVAAVANIVTVTASVQGLMPGHYVRFVGANSAYFDSAPYSVLSVGITNFTVNESNATVIIPGGLNYINIGSDISGANVQVISANHGNPTGANVDIVTSSVPGQIAVAEYTLVGAVTDDTFFIGATANVTSNVTGTSNVVVNDAVTISNTPVRAINLSGDTTRAEAIATVSAITDYPLLGAVPNTTNKVYFSHKPAYDSVGVEFTLHEDPEGTLATLGLTASEYTKSDNTVKAKLERWINNLVVDKTVPLLLAAKSTTKYSTYGVSNLGSYTIDLDTVNGEINFDSREDARDFNSTVNSIYHDRFDASVKGIVNLKTNIELLTAESAAVLPTTSTYGAPNEIIIPVGSSPLPTLISSTVDQYNVYFIDYSIIDNSLGANINYVRSGTLNIAVHSENFGSNVVLQDIATDALDSGVTGNITFSAAVTGTNTIQVSSVNTLNGGGIESTMRFVSRRWISNS